MERDERRRADALDRYWDSAQRGKVPRRPSDVDKVAARVVDHLGNSPAPPDMNAARLRVRQRIAAADSSTEKTMHASAVPLPTPGRLAPTVVGPRPSTTRHRHQRIQLALAAMLPLALGYGYTRVGPGLRDDGGPANVPAVVVLATAIATPDAATPVGTLFPRVGHAIVGVWKWDYFPCDPGRNTSHAIFDASGDYVEYESGGISVGTWRATGERTVELVAISRDFASLNSMFGVEENLPLPAVPIEDAVVATSRTIELDDTGTTFVGRGFYEPRGANGEVIVHLNYSDDCNSEMLGTKVAPDLAGEEGTPTPDAL